MISANRRSSGKCRITRSDAADIAQAREPGNDETEGNGAQQITGKGRREIGPGKAEIAQGIDHGVPAPESSWTVYAAFEAA